MPTATSEATPGPMQIAKGLRYSFLHCTNGITPGDHAAVDYLSLHLANGDSFVGPTEVLLRIAEEGASQ